MSMLLPQLAQLTTTMRGTLFQVSQPGKETTLTERPDFDFWPALINMIAILALVIGLIVLLGWLLRRFGGARFGGSGGGLMRMVSTLSLGDKKALAVVRAGKRYFLIGIASGQINNLGELDAEEVEQGLESESVTSEAGGFAAILRRMRSDKGES